MARTVLDLLRLLADDAPVGELERAAGQLVDPEAAALTLRIRSAMDAGRRRESELAALVETAEELTSRSDTGDVLDAVVRRARALLGTDLAYLTLYDDASGDTYMRATAGSVSPRFQRLRLPVGAGLGGLVATSRTPHWTGRYAVDERYRHTEEIDAAVAEEGIVAICGTPLLVDDEFVGVLFAANRTARPFPPEEVALLGSLAALAAVSLVQTSRLVELRDANAAIAQAADAHDRFAGVVLEGGDVDALAEALGRLLGVWVAVLDEDGLPAATFGALPDLTGVAVPVDGAPVGRVVAVGRPDPRRPPSTGRARGAGRAPLADAPPTEGAAPMWAVDVVAAGRPLGSLVVGGVPALDDGQRRTVERAAMVTALVLLFTQQAQETDLRERADALTELLSSAGEPRPVTLGRLRSLGVAVRRPHVLLAARCAPGTRRAALRDAGDLAGRSGLVAEHDGLLVALVPGSDAPGSGRRLARPAVADDPESTVTVGAAGPVVPASGLGEALAEARRSVEALLALGRRGESGSVAELGFAGLLLGGQPDVGGYVSGVLGPVAEHDERRGSELLRTLECYYAAGSSPSRAAAALHVHANTVAQRLERVGALLGDGWQEPDRALEIQLALRLHRLGTSGPARP